MNKNIKIGDLPIDMRNKLPISIQLQNECIFDDLDDNIKHLIYKFYDDIELNRIRQLNNILVDDTIRLYDVKPTISLYSDLEYVTDIKSLIRYYLSNFLSISTSSYPYNVDFGCNLKKYIQIKESSLSKELITTEIKNIIQVISLDYDTKVQILSMNIYNTVNPKNSSLTYNISIVLKINDIEDNVVLKFD